MKFVAEELIEMIWVVCYPYHTLHITFHCTLAIFICSNYTPPPNIEEEVESAGGTR